MFAGGANEDTKNPLFGSWREKAMWFRKDRAAQKEVEQMEKIAMQQVPDDSSECSSDESEEENKWFRNCPGFGAWVSDRCTTPSTIAMLLVFGILVAVNTIAKDDVIEDYQNISSVEKSDDYVHPNIMAMIVFINGISLLISLSLTFCLEGTWAIDKVLEFGSLWRFAGIAALFQCAQRLVFEAYIHGLPFIIIVTLGYIYIPISLFLKYMLMQKHYGPLELVAVCINLLSAMAYVFLREKCSKASLAEGTCKLILGGKSYDYVFGISALVIANITSATASVLAERIFKDKSSGLRRIHEGLRHNHYYVHKVHLDFCSLVLALLGWSLPIKTNMTLLGMPKYEYWFGPKSLEGWDYWIWLNIFSSVGLWWFCGLIAKKFDTVVKALCQTLAVILTQMVADEYWSRIFRQTVKSKAVYLREVPCGLLILIFVLAVLVFQTGRVHVKALKKVCGIQHGTTLTFESVWHQLRTMKYHFSGDITGGEVKREKTNLSELLHKYSVLIIYVVVYVINTEVQTIAVGQSVCTSQVFACVLNVVQVFYDILMVTFKPPEGHSGIEDLKESFDLKFLMKFSGVGFLAAITSMAISFALGLGMNGAMKEVLGKFYVPVGSFLSAFILGRFYLWLEWFAIIIAFFASIVFGLLGSAGGNTGGVAAIAAAIIAASVAAVQGLWQQKLFTDELKAGKPFMMQKLRADVGMLIWSFVFLVPAGMIAPGYDKGGFWRFRPQTFNCYQAGSCGIWADGAFQKNGPETSYFTFDAYSGRDYAWFADRSAGNWTYLAVSPTEALAGCHCTNDFFVGFDGVWVYVGLVFAAVYAYYTGLVATTFGFSLRTVADNFGLMLIYFAGDPLRYGYPISSVLFDVGKVPQNLTLVILPFASQLQIMAAEELSKFEDLQKQEIAAEDSGDDESGTERQHSREKAPLMETPEECTS